MSAPEVLSVPVPMPADWREGPDGTCVCPHHDLMVCKPCRDAHPEAVDVYGATFWLATPEARSVFQHMLGGGA